MKELIEIQAELKAPENQFNKFGGYKYRSCEDILEAVKPLATSRDCLVKVDDEIVMLGDRYYVKATASIKNNEGITETATAYAREPQTKKGMDEAQITGSTSSYARKYALNGLFCIDDTKDADSANNHDKEPERNPDTAMEEIKAFRVAVVKDVKQQLGIGLDVMLKDLEQSTKDLFDQRMKETVGVKDIMKATPANIKKAYKNIMDK